ncbi:MAG TPA: ABC transporter substrate-binding protein [Candidatus Binatia bacterium]|nr:ABC transporter substrate-binding protein [Candidatus Binatia bacterium]
MKNENRPGWSRRQFMNTLGLAGTGALVGLRSESIAAEPPPETKRIRLVQAGGMCQAPKYVAEDFLRGEGFTDVQYVKKDTNLGNTTAVAAGEADISIQFSGPVIVYVDGAAPIVILAGVHPGCFELFGTQRVRAIRDLKGKTVAVPGMGSPQHVFISSMVAYVGLDPRKDVHWVTYPFAEAAQLLAEGKIDAFLGFPPEPQELRAKKIGQVVVNSMTDRPWSQYFCCMVIGNRDFVRKHPVATKRTLRAIMKATDVSAREPERVARFLVDKGYTKNYEYALQTTKEMQMSYQQWREYDPEDTIRFYSLRLHEVGMIKSSPPKIMAQGTDWRFLREIKKELKG